MRSRLLGATGWAVALVVGAASASACSDDEGAPADATLPPIATLAPTTPTTAAPTTTVPLFYEVQSGDTLTQIADAYSLPIKAIMDANGITNQDAIQAGQILELPRAADIVANSLPAGATTTGPAATTVAP